MLPVAPSSLAGRAPALLRCGRRVPRASLPVRSFTTAHLNGRSRWSPSQPQKVLQQKRLGTITITRAYSSPAADAQSAPNPKAYIDSGVIKPKQSVDVKKVLVIGSGGLAIGQAGEFDYSGMSSPDP
jgi:carbamoyl-phosphate synthase large subunit